MSRNAAYIPLYPWSGGLNVSQDPIILDPQQLQICDNVVFTTSGSRKKRGGQARLNTAAITVGTAAQDVIYLTDYWSNVSNTKTQRLVAVTEDGTVHASSDSGSTWTVKTSAAVSVTHGKITSEVINEDLIIGYSESSAPLSWDNQGTATISTATASSGTYPDGWILRGHKNRLFVAGDETQRDRIQISAAGDHTDWGTASTFIDIQPGDGDPDGITAIFPEIRQAKGLYIAKRTKIYFLDTSSSSTSDWSVTVVSEGIGCISHNTARAVDQADVVFASDRGIHSLDQVINQTGIVEGKFLSAPIHQDYQNNLSTGDRFRYSAVWYSKLNSYMIGVKKSGDSKFQTIYCYNVELGQWYRWTSAPCNFLALKFNASNDEMDLIAGDDGGFVNQLDKSDNLSDLNDFGSAILTKIKSAVIYPSVSQVQNPIPGETHFTNLVFSFRARDNNSFRVFYTVDQRTNSFTVDQILNGGNTLGSTALGIAGPFILGTIGNGIKPYFNHIKGVGHSIEIEIQHDTVNSDFELFGMWIEFKPASESQNSRRNTGS